MDLAFGRPVSLDGPRQEDCGRKRNAVNVVATVFLLVFVFICVATRSTAARVIATLGHIVIEGKKKSNGPELADDRACASTKTETVIPD